jgi:hypothetical protein
VLPATLSTILPGTYHDPMCRTKSSRFSSCTVSTVPATGQPSGWSPKQASVSSLPHQAAGWSYARLISCCTTVRSRSTSPPSISALRIMSASTSIARSSLSKGTWFQ